MKFNNEDERFLKAFDLIIDYSSNICLKKKQETFSCYDECDGCEYNVYLYDLRTYLEKKQLVIDFINCNRTYPRECGQCIFEHCSDSYCATKLINMFKLPVK